MPFSFGEISLKESKKNTSTAVKEALIFSRGGPAPEHLLFVLDTFHSRGTIDALRIWIERSVPKTTPYSLVCLSKLAKTAEDIKKEGVTAYYKVNGIDLGPHIKPNTIIISIGRAIYGITQDSNIHINCFYDLVFNETYFYSPDYKCNVFPIDAPEDLFKTTPMGVLPKDSFRMHFADYQIKKICKNILFLARPETPRRLKITKFSEKEQVDKFLKERTPAACKVAWDLETSGLSFVNDRIGCITMSFDGAEGFYLPWQLVDKNLLTEFFKNKYQIGQNLKFDIKFLHRNGIPTANVNSDTLPLAQTLNESRANGLKALAFYYTQYGGYDRDLDTYWRTFSPKTYLDIPEKILSQYATMDAIINFQVHEKMQHQMDELDKKYPPPNPDWWTIREYYEKKRIPAFKMFIPVEMRGVEVDMDIWDANSDKIDREIKKLQYVLSEKLKVKEFLGGHGMRLMSLSADTLFDEEDPDSDFGSGKQLGELLKWLGWENLGLSKMGYYLTGDEQLTRWEQLGRTEASLLKELRAYRTLQKTFLGTTTDTTMGWRQHLKHHEESGRFQLHPSYRVMGAESGRNTCSEPNWQQGPSHSLGADLVKEVISVPDKDDCLLATMDYSGLQLRLAAIDSGDKVLTNAYMNDIDADIHSTTGWNVFCANREFELDEIVVTQNGKSHIYFPHESLRVVREGKIIEIKVIDLRETDELTKK